MTDYDWKNDKRVEEVLSRLPSIHFPARELEPYPEPVRAAELQEGLVYFSLNYVDDEKLIPVMETIVFIGRNLSAGDVKICYFQDIQSYDEGTTFETQDEDPYQSTFYTRREDELNDIFQFEFSLEELMRCSLRRSQALRKE